MNSYLLYRQECFTGKYTTRKIHTKLHPGPEWHIYHFLTSEYIDDVISEWRKHHRKPVKCLYPYLLCCKPVKPGCYSVLRSIILRVLLTLFGEMTQ